MQRVNARRETESALLPYLCVGVDFVGSFVKTAPRPVRDLRQVVQVMSFYAKTILLPFVRFTISSNGPGALITTYDL